MRTVLFAAFAAYAILLAWGLSAAYATDVPNAGEIMARHLPAHGDTSPPTNCSF